jgi:hypothetical protein
MPGYDPCKCFLEARNASLQPAIAEAHLPFLYCITSFWIGN